MPSPGRTTRLKRFRAAGGKSGCSIPLISRGPGLGVLCLGRLSDGAFTDEDVEALTQIANQVAIAVENALSFREIDALKNKLAEEKLYLEEEIRTEHNFEEIVGKSLALKRALQQVEMIAQTDSTVLIVGETGKELLARAIHNLSPRRQHTFVEVNCAAIPTGLLESELFGHEKGVFTGAVERRLGRFELAHQGTIFLDEVGDVPLELQPKLLRVLQEQEFERLGNSHMIRMDTGVVDATNGAFARMVADKQRRAEPKQWTKAAADAVRSARLRDIGRAIAEKFAGNGAASIGVDHGNHAAAARDAVSRIRALGARRWHCRPS
jgi:formate hydrogenlyase transcriptional activator